MRHFVFGDPELLGEPRHQLVAIHDPAVRLQSGDRFDTANAGRDACLRDDLEQADLPGAAHMRPSAQLETHARDHDRPHDIPVLLTEQRHRAGLDGLGIRALFGPDFVIGQDRLVHVPLYGLPFLVGQGTPVAEVEAQSVGSDQRAGLVNVLAEDRSQGGVEEVRRRVVALGLTAE